MRGISSVEIKLLGAARFEKTQPAIYFQSRIGVPVYQAPVKLSSAVAGPSSSDASTQNAIQQLDKQLLLPAG